MRASLKPDGLVIIHGDVRSESFTSVHAGVGWPDGEPGGVVVVGRREDGRYHILEEKRGRLFELAEASWKSRRGCWWTHSGSIRQTV